MARYTGSVCRLCRRSGEKLMLKGDRCYGPKCALDRRNKPPGPHGVSRRRMSDRGVQLREKQKAKYGYGLFERQFKRFFAEAEKKGGVTGDNLVLLLERRLDNVIYRLGFADSRAQARQLVQHGHITVNGRKTDIPSYLVKAGDVLAVRPESRRLAYFRQRRDLLGQREVPAWLSLNEDELLGRVLAIPTRQDIDTPIDEQMIVEFYSR